MLHILIVTHLVIALFGIVDISFHMWNKKEQYDPIFSNEVIWVAITVLVAIPAIGEAMVLYKAIQRFKKLWIK